MTVLSDVTDVQQHGYDITLTLTLSLKNKNKSNKNGNEILNEKASVQALYIWQWD